MTGRDVEALVRGAIAGQLGDIARLITLVEERGPGLREAMTLLAAHGRSARVIGLTGPPGVGKSTITGALVSEYRKRDLRVGVLAIDPSSPFSGGAFLGDRVRMQQHAMDPEVFIRSMANRGHLGGLAVAAPQALRVLEAAGCDIVLIETVGVGQAEIEVASLVDSTVVLLAPGMGDAIQGAKAGILEVADVFVINKADRDGAAQTAKELRFALSFAARDDHAWAPPILKAEALHGKGVDAIALGLDEHHRWLASSGHLEMRRRARALAEIEQIAILSLRRRARSSEQARTRETLVDRMLAGELDPYSAAEELAAALAD